MKKNLILFLTLILCVTNYAQKKKIAKSTEKISKSSTALAKVDNLELEIKNTNFQITINGSGKSNDAIVIKNIDSKFIPTETKLIAFTASGTKLYLVSWTEKIVTKTENKNEESVTIFSQIYDIATKTLLFVNTQLTSKITEKVFLDRLKNASETQERLHKEGYELTLNPDGSLIQRSKTKEVKLVFDPKTLKYNEIKKK